VRNRWIRPTIVAAILFVVVALIVFGCSMKHRASAKLSAKPAGKSAQQTTAHKVRGERPRANAHDSLKPCVVAPSVVTQQESTGAQTEDGTSSSARALPSENTGTGNSRPMMPSTIRILIAIETEKQPDPALRLFQPPAQAGRRPPSSGWQRFRPQAGN
jgi:hypothetical protein